MRNKELIEGLYARAQMQKWRNITVLLVVILLFVIFKSLNTEQNIGRTPYIARINIDGVIESNNYLYEKLDEITEDSAIKAVIVNVNSPGGEVVSSEIIFNKLRNMNERKPIVVVMGNIAASGGYLISLASDHIIAGNGTITGSIGVLFQTYEILELMQKIGIKPIIYKSGELKATPSFYEKPTEKVDKVLNESIQDSYKFFTELVSNRRNMSMEKTIKLSDGRIYTGRQAVKAGLIDEIGYEDEALKYLHDSKGINTQHLKVHTYEVYEPLKDFNIRNFFGSKASINAKSGMMAIYQK